MNRATRIAAPLAESVPTNAGRRRAYAALVLSCLFLFTFSACNRDQKSEDTVAKVNGTKITRAEVNKYFESQTAGSPQRPQGEEADSLRLNILDQLILRQLVFQRAEKVGVLASDDDVERKITELKQPYTEEQFKQQLSQSGRTESDLRTDIRYQLTADKLLNKEVVSKITVTDADVEKYYNANRAEFNLIEPRYHLAQIVVTPEPATAPGQTPTPGAKAQNEQQARAKIQMILNRLESGEDFALLAKSYSEDPNTAGNGGDIGMINESVIKSKPSVFAEIAKLKPGQHTGVITETDPTTKKLTTLGIFKLLEKDPAGQRQLQDPAVQQFIRDKLRSQREQLLQSAYFDVIRNEAKIENYYAEDLLKQGGVTGK